VSLAAAESEVDGVFGLSPMTETAALAIWVPLHDGESISGIKWYNNDGSLAYPSVKAIAGECHGPESLAGAYSVGEYVSGGTLEWSEMAFDQPIASETSGLYVVFELPMDGEFISEGSGSGVGYSIMPGEIRSWVSMEPDVWHALNPEYQMSIEAVMNSNKSSHVLVLGQNMSPTMGSGEKNEIPIPLLNGLMVAPNPFNPQTEISFGLPARCEVSLTVYDVRGRKIQSLVNGPLAAGNHTVSWNGHDDQGRAQSSGVYFALLDTGQVRMTRRMTLLK